MRPDRDIRSLSDALKQDEAEYEQAQPATSGYTGTPCPVCGRIRVYLRNDGKYQCEKCESVFGAAPAQEGTPP